MPRQARKKSESEKHKKPSPCVLYTKNILNQGDKNESF